MSPCDFLARCLLPAEVNALSHADTPRLDAFLYLRRPCLSVSRSEEIASIAYHDCVGADDLENLSFWSIFQVTQAVSLSVNQNAVPILATAIGGGEVYLAQPLVFCLPVRRRPVQASATLHLSLP